MKYKISYGNVKYNGSYEIKATSKTQKLKNKMKKVLMKIN